MPTSQPARPTPTFEILRDSLYQSLLDHILLDEQDTTNKRFFPSNTGPEVLQSYDLKQIFDWVLAAGGRFSLTRDDFADRVKVRELQTFLAILIYSNCTIRTVRSFVNSLVVPEQWPLSSRTGGRLGELPVSRQDAQDILGDSVAADSFWKSQDEFCAVVIQQNEEVVCDGHRRLPYLDETSLGLGSFGTVCRVDIAPHHFLTKEGHRNPKAYIVARKDYILTEGSTHVRERDFLRELLRNPKKHDNILRNLGSLQMGSTYSLFMELADCDLWDYMTVHHPEAPTTLKGKATILHCAVELAEAVAYLHDDIRTDRFEKLSCFHMDLKPRNILVVTEKDEKTGDRVQRWKLSDFNMSKAKAKHKSDRIDLLQRSRTFADNIYDFNKLFKKRRQTVNDPSLTEATANPRGDGTYLAPEACIKGGKVQAESDTWSLGCVLCVVFSYLDSGSKGVLEFRDLRSVMPKDQFFTIYGSKVRLSLSVHKWLKELRARAYRRNREEGAIMKDFLAFLHRQVLVVDHEKRKNTRASEIAQELVKSFQSYDKLANLYPPLDGPLVLQVPSRPDKRKKKGFLSFSSGHRRPSPPLEPVVPSLNSWQIDLPDSMRASTCEFGPNGDILVYISNSTLFAVSLRNVLDTTDVEDLIEFGSEKLEGLSWTSIAVSSQYIVATTNQPLFDVSVLDVAPEDLLIRRSQCHVFYISDSSTHTSRLEKKDRILLKLPPIWKLALSPDGKYCAFVLRNYDSENSLGQVYIIPLDLLLSGGSNR
jgi:serine/threonine protein kinase